MTQSCPSKPLPYQLCSLCIETPWRCQAPASTSPHRTGCSCLKQCSLVLIDSAQPRIVCMPSLQVLLTRLTNAPQGSRRTTLCFLHHLHHSNCHSQHSPSLVCTSHSDHRILHLLDSNSCPHRSYTDHTDQGSILCTKIAWNQAGSIQSHSQCKHTRQK